MNNKKTNVWLFSTKSVENLYNNEGNKILLNSNNIEEVPIEIEYLSDPLQLTLIDFYSDYCNPQIQTVFNNPSKYQILTKSVEEIKEKLKKYDQIETSSLLFDKIFKMKNCNVFLTRSFPDKLIYDANNNIEKEHLPNYWMISYINTVAKHLKKTLNDLSFFCVLHTSDTPKEDSKYGEEKILLVRGNSTYEIRIMRIKYSHDLNDDNYTNIIKNKNFLDYRKENDVDSHILKELCFPGIFNRIEILKKLGIDTTKKLKSIEDGKYLNYYLDCNNSQFPDKEELFKSTFKKKGIVLLKK